LKLNRLHAEAAETGDQAENIEDGMNGVAGTRMVQREFEQRFGRHACAGPASPTRAGVNSRRSVSERDDGTGVFISGYSAGTDASRNRIE